MNLVRNPKHVVWAVRLSKARGLNLYWQHRGTPCQHGRKTQCCLCMDEAFELQDEEPKYYVRMEGKP